jgi:tryptophanyl-tRNA synthetase
MSTTTLHAGRPAAALEERVLADPTRFRVLTGDRPTGRLHLGHYFGTLRNRVRLQDLGVEMFVIIADYQVLTDRDVADNLTGHVEDLVLDYLAIGVDPTRSTIFAHSAVPALNQLLVPFLSLVSVAELERNPTVKDEIAHSRQASVSGLMFTYPAHQAADILFCKAGSGRPGPAPSPGAGPDHRSPLQRPLRRRCVSPARCPVVERAAAARHGRHQEEQEPGQCRHSGR